MRRPPYQTVFPVHAGSQLADLVGNGAGPVDRHERRALIAAVRSFDRRLRRRGFQGALGRAAICVLEVLLFKYLNVQTRRCDPSHESIAEASNMSVRTVQRALQRLMDSKLISWTRRFVKEIGPLGGFLMRQVSNFYVIEFNPPWRISNRAPAPDGHSWGATPWEGDTGLDRMLLARQAGCTLEEELTIAQREAEGEGDAWLRFAVTRARLRRDEPGSENQ